MRVAFTGRAGLGGAMMRGKAVSQVLGVPFVETEGVSTQDRIDTLVLVKYWGDPDELRGKCDRLIFDPLDCWSSFREWLDAEPADFWRWTHRVLRFDEIIATSPACARVMRDALPRVPVHLAPHHADPAISPSCYAPKGSVVYAGRLRYIESELRSIQKACKRLGRRLVVEKAKWTPTCLEGASLFLHLRLPPTDTPLNRHCKPQVKLENAAAAGLPVLASPDPCVTSLRPGVTESSDDWERGIEAALRSEPLANPVSLDEHARTMERILLGTA